MLPTSRAGKIAAGFFAIFLLAMNPPVVTVVSRNTSVMGIATLYLWFVCWGVIGTLVLGWAAHRNAFGLTEEQVPPEIDGSAATSPGPDGDPSGPGVD